MKFTCIKSLAQTVAIGINSLQAEFLKENQPVGGSGLIHPINQLIIFEDNKHIVPDQTALLGAV